MGRLLDCHCYRKSSILELLINAKRHTKGFVIVWFSLVYPMVTVGGAGKHAYNLTYREMYWYKYVRLYLFGISGSSYGV